MPGIAGVIGRGDVDECGRTVRRMVDVMAHEPSYATGTIAEPSLGVCVGWVVHAGSYSDCLPIWNQAGDVCLIFSGEHYGCREDVGRLGSLGHDRNEDTARDLLNLYEQTGPRFFRSLNGIFGGVLIDRRQHQAVLFNDRFGLHRIYYHEHRDGLYFASEAKALLRVLPELRHIDLAALGEFFRCGCVMRGKTLFPGIEQVPGGATWTARPGARIVKSQFFDPREWEQQPQLDDEEFGQSLVETFTRALPRYCRNDGDQAMSLTGGLDGRMIMAWARPAPAALPCYTFAGEFRDCADVKIARSVAAMCGQDHQTIAVGAAFCREFGDLAQRCVYLSDGTMDVTGSVELYANRIARNIAPVRVTGNYGSEIVRGNVAFGPGRLASGLLSADFLPHVEAAEGTYASARSCRDLTFIAFKQVPWHHYARFAIEQSQLTTRSPYLDNEIVALMYRAPDALLHSRQPSLDLIAKGDERLARLPTDRGCVIESSPMAGAMRKVVRELTMKAEYAYDYGMPQWLAIIDHALRPLRLERLFLGRHKFYHFRIWYRDRLANYVKEMLLDPRSLQRPYLNRGFVESMIEQHCNGTRNYTTEIHLALTAELAHRALIEQA